MPRNQMRKAVVEKLWPIGARRWSMLLFPTIRLAEHKCDLSLLPCTPLLVIWTSSCWNMTNWSYFGVTGLSASTIGCDLSAAMAQTPEKTPDLGRRTSVSLTDRSTMRLPAPKQTLLTHWHWYQVESQATCWCSDGTAIGLTLNHTLHAASSGSQPLLL